MTTTTTTHERAARYRLPSRSRLGWQRVALELRAFRRVREEVVFTFALPIMLLVLFALIRRGEIEDTGVDFSQYIAAAMLAATGITVGFQSLSGQLALEQHDGTLKRLAGTPMPKAAYIVGKIGMVCTIAAVQAVTMLAIGVAAFDVTLPNREGWALLVSVLVLNLAIWTLLGLAFSRLIRNPRAGGAAAVPPALVLQFISGIYIQFNDLPSWIQAVASIFPLRWAALGSRRALLPDEFQVLEPGESWQTPTMYLVLSGWLLGSAALAGIFFRWRVRE